MSNREKIFNNKEKLLEAQLQKQTKFIEYPFYFKAWLSGFIEAEGNFSLVFNKEGRLRKSAFAIGQNDELHLLNMVKFYFQSENKILKDKPKINPTGIIKITDLNHYRLFLYNALSRKLLFEHFNSYPLLGEKKVSYMKFFEYHNNINK